MTANTARAALTAFLLVCAAAVVGVPFYANQGVVFLTGVTIINGIFAMSWALLFARTGLMVFGHAGFFAIGAYTVGYLLRTHAEVPFLACVIGAVLLSAAVGAIIGTFVVGRVSGVAFAILTLALAEILRTIISYSELLGREDGLSGIPRPNMTGGLLAGPAAANAYYWFICVACVLLALFLYWFSYGRLGRILFCIKQDAQRTAFLGHNVRYYRIMSLTAAAAVAGAAGGIYAPWAQIVTPEIGNILQSTQPMLNTLLGGAGFFGGPVLGAAIFTAISYFTRTLLGLSEVITGGVLLVIIMVAPSGVLGLASNLMNRYRRLEPAANFGSGQVEPQRSTP